MIPNWAWFASGMFTGLTLASATAWALVQMARPPTSSAADPTSTPTGYACDGCPETFVSNERAIEHAMADHGAPSRDAAEFILTPIDELTELEAYQ